ncbi:MAG: hypothetical protein GYB33_11440 [Gammaproteobacteria bacterium]|nr:hypothetical protein [Gammaproteobacteria bacterium]
MDALNTASINLVPEAETAPWERVRELRLRLKRDCNIYRHRYLGHNSYIIKDALTSAHFRLTELAWRLLSQLDGQLSVEAAYESLSPAERAALSHDDAIRLLAGLRQAELLETATDSAGQDWIGLSARPGVNHAAPGAGRERWRDKLKRPFMIKLPLWNPDRSLDIIVAWTRPLLLSRLLLPAALLLLGWACLQTGRQWLELQEHWQSRFLDPYNLLSLWLLYPLIKLVHELAHGVAVKLRGGSVKEMGVMLLLLMPIPYVNASASTTFTNKYQRLWVAAAGIVAELLLAVVALALWLGTEPGLVRDLAFNTLFIGAASTLLFNGNPLLRFDGYYVLCDWLEMPNLGTRAQQYLGYLTQRYLFGLTQRQAPMAQRREQPWLLAYGVLSGLYRLLLGVTIALFLASKFFLLGVLLALWFLLLQIALPLQRNCRTLLQAAVAENALLRVAVRGTAVALLVWWALFVLPISQSTRAYGVVQLPEGAELRSGSAGFVEQVLVEPGGRVGAGQALLQLANPELERDLQVLQARKQELEARYRSASATDTVAAAILIGQIKAIDEELRDARQQLQKLRLTSPVEGVLQLPAATDLPGRYVEKGQVLGYVSAAGQLRARVVVNQWDVRRVMEQSVAIQIRLPGASGNIINAELVQAVPSATRELPSALLGSKRGGLMQVDARDERGLALLRSVFQFDVQFTAPGALNLLGSRVLVRFVHSERPLARHLAERLKQWSLESPFLKYVLD